MNKTEKSTQQGRNLGGSEWIWEVLILLTIVPSVVYSFLSIGVPPIV